MAWRSTATARDELNQRDHLAFRNGARVLSQITSPAIPILLSPAPAGPRHVLQPFDTLLAIPEAALGVFVDPSIVYHFAGHHGVLGILLDTPSVPSRVLLKGAPSAVVQTCAARTIVVWALVNVGGRTLHPAGRTAPPALSALKLEGYSTTWLQRRIILQKIRPIHSPASDLRWVLLAVAEDLDSTTADYVLYPTTKLSNQTPPETFAIAIELSGNQSGQNFTCFTGLRLFSM